MPHLCVDARLYDGAGIGTHIKAILPALQEFELTLLVHQVLDLPARQIQMKSSIYTAAEQVELACKIPRCDLFWSPHYNVPLLPIRAKRRLVTVHDVYHLAHYSTLSWKQKLYAKQVMCAALRRSDCVMTDSTFSAHEIERYCFRPKRLEIVPSAPVLSPVKDVKQEYLLYVGSLKPHKNLARLFEAYSRLTDPPRLVVVGKDFGEVALPPNVEYAGRVADEELPRLYARAKLFLFPSTYEGFGLPPLEAMLCGTPTLVGRAASLPEVCGDAAEYVDPFSVESIQRGIEQLLGDPARCAELVEKGYENVKRFTPEKTGAKFRTVVEALL